ncbi:MAG: hypothetical protein M3Z75_20355 [Actinomycetota bacterium]|nr:hypothetical protein [Actinomycetota bacterium]
MKTDSVSAADRSGKTALAQITTYIPSDVVATYVALLGIFSKGSDSVKWGLFGVGVTLCAVLPVLNFLSSRNTISPPAGNSAPLPAQAPAAQPPAAQAPAPLEPWSGDRRPTWGKQIGVIIMAIVAFTAYAMALPSTIFTTVISAASLWGAASALVLAALMPAVAGAIGIKAGAG